ncbi:hypothetical protein HXZ81_14440 [Myroides odoratimimus]|uniref:hypothetical protein n=1 Tax=Myroides odoratimimus TaxID=76832 RepID=UPI002579003A|nr:hypothetical protein [Myroides odoratimimus]MDM1097825.1 hypothetical protein [Myroides odoratimimus]
MTIFLITTATVLFTCLLLNFGQYYFNKIYPYLLGQTILWDKQNDRLKLMIGLTTLFFAYFSFQSIWAAGTVFKALNIILYAILLVSNILFYIIYSRNKMLFNTPSLTTDSEEKKKIEEQIKEQIALEQEEIHFEQKVKEYQEKIQATIDFIKEQKNEHPKINNEDPHTPKDQSLNDNFFQQLPENELQKIYLCFRRDGIIKESMSLKEFKAKFEKKTLQLNLNGPSLYYFHKIIKRHFNISLIKFVTYFKKKNGDSFKYKTVKNGVLQPYPLHKELFEEMFIQ